MAAIVLLTVNFFLSLYNLTVGLMWWLVVVASIGVTILTITGDDLGE